MKDLITWSNVLKTLLGEPPSLRLLPQSATNGLPLILRKGYCYAEMEVFGCRFILVELADATACGKAAALDKLAARLERHLESPCIFTMPALPAYIRQRLVERKIAFICADGFGFIPRLIINIKRPSRLQTADSLGTVAQVILLRHLIRKDIEGKSLTQCRALLPYSLTALHQARAQLEHFGLMGYENNRYRGKMCAHLDAPLLWQRAKVLMQSPVTHTYYLSQKPESLQIPFAAESALSRCSMLVPDELETYAMGSKQFNQWKKSGKCQLAHDREDAACCLQVWRYAPQCIMPQNALIVDAYSLYLSLCKSTDERVLQELNRLF